MKPLRLLLVEDREVDARSIVHAIEGGGYTVTWERVETSAALAGALERHWDVVTCEWLLQHLSVPAALQLLKDRAAEVPIIIVSDALAEGSPAVAAMQPRAHDIVRKTHLPQLVLSVERALQETAARRERTRATAAIPKNERHFRSLVENSLDLVAILNVDGVFQYVSPSHKPASGYNPEELLGRNAFEFIHPDDAAEARRRLADGIRRGQRTGLAEYRVRNKDGSWRYVESMLRNLLDDPAVNGILVNSRDITTRKLAEEALRRNQERFRKVMDALPQSMSLISGAGVPLYVNARFGELFGYTLEEVPTMEAWWPKAYPDPEYREQMKSAWLARIAETARSGLPRPSIEAVVTCKDGSRRYIESHVSRVCDDILAIQVDLTERKRVEEALRQSEYRFFNAFEYAAIGMALVAPDGRWLMVNRALCDLVGYSSEELLTKTFHDITHPDDLGTDLEYVRHMLAGEIRSYQLEKRYFHKRGHVVWILLSVSLVRDAQDLPLYFIAQIQDITDRRRAEEAWRRSEQEKRREIGERKQAQKEQAALFAIATEIGRTANFDDMLDRVQRRTADLLPCDRVLTYRWDAGRMLYRAIAWYGIPDDLVPDTVTLGFRPGEKVVDALLAGQTIVISDAANQHWVPAEIFAHFRLTALALVPLAVHGHVLGALVAHAGSGFSAHQVHLLEAVAQQVGIAMEAHETHRAQQEEAAISAALARVGEELISLSSTPALLNRLCELTTEVLGCDYSHCWLWQPQEQVFVAGGGYGDTPETWEAIRLFRFGRSVQDAQLQQLKSEGILNARISDLAPSEVKTAAAAYGATVMLIVPLRGGDELLGFHVAAYRGRMEPFDPAQERIARGVAHLASLALENVQLMEALGRANRLKSDFMATMSHELRTPLNVIIGYNDILLDGGYGPLAPEQADTLRRTQRSAGELLELINATLDIGRVEAGRSSLDLERVDVAALLREIDSETTTRHEKPNVAVVWRVAKDLPRMRTDRLKVKVVVKNLLGNALKFTEQGQVVVQARARNGGVEIAVTDTGPGIAPHVLPIIFEPFRQGESAMTRHHGGVGLGLYIVRRLLELLGGTIHVESQVDRGSAFRVWLPKNIEAQAPAAQKPPEAAGSSG